MNSRLLSLILSVLLVITLVWFTFYYSQASSTISTGNSTITDLSNEKKVLQAQVAAANSQVVDLQGKLDAGITKLVTNALDIDAAQKQSATLQTQLTQSRTQTANVTAQLQQATIMITALQGQAATLQTQVDADKTQISTLQSQATSLQTQLDTANSDKSSLTSQVTSLTAITGLTVSQTIVSSLLVSASSAGNVTATFSANYAGYVVISGNSTSNGAVIIVRDTFPNYPHNSFQYPFGLAPPPLLIPVLPGTVTVTFHGPGPAIETATMTVTYVY